MARTEYATPKQIAFLQTLIGKTWCQELTAEVRDLIDAPARGPVAKALANLTKSEASAAIEALR